MAVIASVTAVAVSYATDTPTGPTIVCVAAAFFSLSGLAAAVRRLRAFSID